MTEHVNIDADQRNADWIKTLSWDLPTDKDTFLAVIGGAGALKHFLTLPAAEAMPTELRNELTKSGLVEPVEVTPHSGGTIGVRDVPIGPPPLKYRVRRRDV